MLPPLPLPARALCAFAILGAFAARPADALARLDLTLPVLAQYAGAEGQDSYALPIGPWHSATGTPKQMVEGRVSRMVWQLDAANASLLEVLMPLRAQILADGYQTRLDCATEACGGYDFRFSIEILPEPQMHVDLGEFRFYSASTPDGRALSLTISRSGSTAFVQMITVGPEAFVLSPSDPVPQPAPAPLAASPSSEASSLPMDQIERLEKGLAGPLEDLLFPSGTSELAKGDYPSLARLADWLRADPARKIALVGHTDVSGAMAANISLSQKRAASVRQVLLRDYGLPPAQIEAMGVGPLSPRASNGDEAGRARNRRVEAVLLALP